MTFYVLDIVEKKETELPEDNVIAELVFLNKDLFRGCTNNICTMRMYHDQIENLIGKYVEIEVYEFQRETSYDDQPLGEVDPEFISAVSKTLYNMSRRQNRLYEISTLTTLISYSTELMDRSYITTEILESTFSEDATNGYNEYDIFQSIAGLLTLARYLNPSNKNNKFIVDILTSIIKYAPTVMNDFYDSINHKYYVDAIELEINYLYRLRFCGLNKIF